LLKNPKNLKTKKPLKFHQKLKNPLKFNDKIQKSIENSYYQFLIGSLGSCMGLGGGGGRAGSTQTVYALPSKVHFFEAASSLSSLRSSCLRSLLQYEALRRIIQQGITIM